ncbi:MAG: imidazole glycerol phosphate synthase subunit HisH [Candidatus Binatia bacterium]|nr:imidazole glycerol phosphate synthase subunit HisH [Candidatus Binatia bacterium]
MSIAIVDYGMGNLRSVQKALERVGAQAVVSRDPHVIAGAAGVVLPGVGAFGACMENLQRFGLEQVVLDVIEQGKPFFGICLGMQLLFEESEEFGPVRGLGVLPGKVVRFRTSGELPVPHMGWNQLRVRPDVPHLKDVADGAYVYFVHSYYVVPSDPAVVATRTEYGVEFASAVYWRNIFATQYHPEKSQRVGLTLLRNFVELVERGA